MNLDDLPIQGPTLAVYEGGEQVPMPTATQGWRALERRIEQWWVDTHVWLRERVAAETEFQNRSFGQVVRYTRERHEAVQRRYLVDEPI